MKTISCYWAVVGFALATFSMGAGAAELYSLKTSLEEKDCAVIESSNREEAPEIDHVDAICPGVGDYSLKVRGVDLRYGVYLNTKGDSWELGLPPRRELGAFYDRTGEAEWLYRIEGHGGQKYVSYRALAYQLNVTTYDLDTGKNINDSVRFLVRLRGQKSCVVGKLNRSAYEPPEDLAMADVVLPDPQLELEKAVRELAKDLDDKPCIFEGVVEDPDAPDY